MRRQMATALMVFAMFTVATGVLYPLAVTAIARVAFPWRANGSLIEHNGTVIGSELLGQTFTGPRDFHPRPSAAGDGYDAAASGGSNLGPSNPQMQRTIRVRADRYREQNRLARSVKIPIDAVTASGSGLDPHISPRNARLQAARVARSRRIALRTVLQAIDRETDDRAIGILGEPGVNVLRLNNALDRIG